MSKRTKEILILLLLGVAFLAVTVVTASDKALSFRDYTAYSANRNGVSLLFDTLERLGYPVEVSTRSITPNTGTQDLQIIVCPSPFYASHDDMDALLKWVERGGRVLLFYNDEDTLVSSLRSGMAGALNTDFYMGRIYNYGMGYAYFQHASDILNVHLMDNSEPGGYILELIDGFGYGKIQFNEYYHGYGTEENIWDAAPLNIKLVVYQLIIVSAAVVLYLGKRFGKPIPYYEEQEREENEYVATLSNLYMQVGMGEVIVEMFRDQFLRNAIHYFRLGHDADINMIHRYWQAEKLPGLEKLEYIMVQADQPVNTKKTGGRHEFIKIVETIKELNRIVSKQLF